VRTKNWEDSRFCGGRLSGCGGAPGEDESPGGNGTREEYLKYK